jgi:flagellar hook-length control protein FliK
VEIASHAQAGHRSFEIRLDPAELGKIDIRLDISRDGQALTHIAVEKPETLDLLRQDARALERALSDAGLDARRGSLSFSLGDGGAGAQNGRDMAQEGNENGSPSPSLPSTEKDEMAENATFSRTRLDVGIDISI